VLNLARGSSTGRSFAGERELDGGGKRKKKGNGGRLWTLKTGKAATAFQQLHGLEYSVERASKRWKHREGHRQ
jgi:hypothetical protein